MKNTNRLKYCAEYPSLQEKFYNNHFDHPINTSSKYDGYLNSTINTSKYLSTTDTDFQTHTHTDMSTGLIQFNRSIILQLACQHSGIRESQRFQNKGVHDASFI